MMHDLPDGQSYVGVLPQVLTKEECETALEIIERRGTEDALTGSGFTPDVRNGSVRFLPRDKETEFLYRKFWDAMYYINENMRFQILGSEQIQIAEYREGEHYDWHIDSGNGPAQWRKMSMVVQLSANEDFEGGGTEVYLSTPPYEAPIEQGTAIAFPSYMLHRAKPVTSGVRYAAVLWFTGNRYQ